MLNICTQNTTKTAFTFEDKLNTRQKEYQEKE